MREVTPTAEVDARWAEPEPIRLGVDRAGAADRYVCVGAGDRLVLRADVFLGASEFAWIEEAVPCAPAALEPIRLGDRLGAADRWVCVGVGDRVVLGADVFLGTSEFASIEGVVVWGRFVVVGVG